MKGPKLYTNKNKRIKTVFKHNNKNKINKYNNM